jgi:ankyrin repeat protein
MEEKTLQKEFLQKIKTKSNLKELSEFYQQNSPYIDINEIDSDKRSPLAHAILSKNYDAVKFLLSLKNLNSNTKDSVNIKFI